MYFFAVGAVGNLGHPLSMLVLLKFRTKAGTVSSVELSLAHLPVDILVRGCMLPHAQPDRISTDCILCACPLTSRR